MSNLPNELTEDHQNGLRLSRSGWRPWQFSLWHLLVLAGLVAAAMSWWMRPPIDRELAARVPVVLRIDNIGNGKGSKYLWTDVRVLKIYKNAPDFDFAQMLSIGCYSFGPGIPGGECTVYLVPYGDPNLRLWKLYETDSVTGVSHVLR